MSSATMKPAVHPFQTDDPRLHSIHEKVLGGQPLDLADVTALFASKDILAIGWLANYVREQRHGNATQYRVDTVVSKGAQTKEAGMPAFVVVGGNVEAVCRNVDLCRKDWADAPISATAVEQLAGGAAKNALRKLRDAGANSLIGNGAELFLPAVRKAIWHGASTAESRAEVRSLAAEMGITTPAYVVQRPASPEQQATEFLNFRELQAEAFSSISYDPDATTGLNLAMTTGMQEMKQIAIARLALPNIPHIRAYWQMLGGKLVQIALRFGASYLDGTSLDTAVTQPDRAKDLAREITVAGCEPREVATSRRVIIFAN